MTGTKEKGHDGQFDKQETPRTDAIAKYGDHLALADLARQIERELAEYEGGKNGDVPPTEFTEVGKRNWRIGYWMDQAGKAKLALSATRESVLEEAAKICEQMRPVIGITGRPFDAEPVYSQHHVATVQRDTLDNAARLIRSLRQTSYVGCQERKP